MIESTVDRQPNAPLGFFALAVVNALMRGPGGNRIPISYSRPLHRLPLPTRQAALDHIDADADDPYADFYTVEAASYHAGGETVLAVAHRSKPNPDVRMERPREHTPPLLLPEEGHKSRMLNLLIPDD